MGVAYREYDGIASKYFDWIRNYLKRCDWLKEMGSISMTSRAVNCSKEVSM